MEIVTFNCQGLRSSDHRETLFSWLNCTTVVFCACRRHTLCFKENSLLGCLTPWRRKFYLSRMTVYRPRGPMAVLVWRLYINLTLNYRLVPLTKSVVLFVGTFPQKLILFKFVRYMAPNTSKQGGLFLGIFWDTLYLLR